ncbi:MAG: type 2 lantipeptide synthetase LanM, partial [Acidobacteria bacterium]|nr:type 2 lantipeptide synthetase LanM [Acidobacteriota bacterium]
MTPPGAQAIRIADRAASLWERLGDSRDAPAESGGALEETARRLDRWRDVAAQGSAPAFERRLAWDGLTLPAVQAALDRAESPAPSLEWLEPFGELIESIEFCRRDPPATIARDEGRPRPFEEVVRPLVQAARRRLHRVMGCPDSAALPSGLLCRRAYLALELGLLDRLCRICAASLQEQFGRTRPIGLTLLNALGGTVGTTSTRHYDAFVEELLSTNLMPFFEAYPALARVVTIVIGNWVAHCAEFQSRLLSDLPLIEATFQPDADRPLGTVADLRVALSDVHRHGRFVLGLTFSSGLKLAYKPKSLGIDLAFNDFIRWCNRQGVTLDLKATRILDRPGYGWMEWIDQQPCAGHEDAARFYRRAGLLLGLLHVLRGTDCHHENLVAAGPHLVLVDAETLMSPDLHTPGDAIGPASHEAFWQSVVRTGMLPCWEMRAGPSIPFDISGLGGVEPQAAPAEVAKWTDINTDGMGVSFGPLMLPRRTNAAILDGVVLSVGDHVPELVAGFAEMYGLLMR